MRTKLLAAWKNESEFWREEVVSCVTLRAVKGDMICTCNNKENGRHFWNSAVPRNFWKKFGQLLEVKLLPRLVSKALGKGELMSALGSMFND